MEFNLFSFPFEQIGWGLRQLSLSGSIGNVVAILFYGIISFSPMGIFVILKKHKRSYAADFMLPVLSILLFVMMYYMINPGLIVSMVAGAGRMMWGATFYSVLVTYLVIRLLGTDKRVDLKSLQKTLRIVLVFILFLFAGSVAIEIFINLPEAWTNLAEKNTGIDASQLTLTYIALALRSIASAIPNALSAVAVFLSVKVLKELLEDAYSETAVVMVRKIGVFCRRSLIVVAVVIMLVNVLQLMFASKIYDVHIWVSIPVFAILFLLVIHLLAKYMEENQRLKKDIDLFI